MIEGSYDSVRLSFHGGAPDIAMARFATQLPRDEPDDVGTMLALFRLGRTRTLSIARAAQLLQKSVRETAMVLRRLALDAPGLIERTLQNLLDVSMLKARDILANPAEHGALMRVSAQSRGPKVEWGPGPNFPSARQRRSAAAKVR